MNTLSKCLPFSEIFVCVCLKHLYQPVSFKIFICILSHNDPSSHRPVAHTRTGPLIYTDLKFDLLSLFKNCS